MSDDSLLTAMDDAVKALLVLVTDPPAEGADEPITVSEKVKIFSAANEYVQWRQKPAAPPPTKSRFQALKQDFNSDAGRNKASGGRTKPAANGAVDSA